MPIGESDANICRDLWHRAQEPSIVALLGQAIAPALDRPVSDR